MKEEYQKLETAKNAKDGTAKLHMGKFVSMHSCTLNVKPAFE